MSAIELAFYALFLYLVSVGILPIAGKVKLILCVLCKIFSAAPYMLEGDSHVKYIEEILNTKDLLYYLTEPSRIVTMYWAVNSLRILSDPLFQELRPSVLEFLKSCLNSDGGFGGLPGYPSTVTMTFHALQVLFLYNVPYFSPRTVKFLVEHQDNDGAFIMDKFGEKDTRIDCCGILSLHLLSLMRDHISKYSQKITTIACFLSENDDNKVTFETKELSESDDLKFSENFGCFMEHNEEPIDRRRLARPVPISFLDECGFDHTSFLIHLLRCYNSDGGFGQIEGSESHSAQVFCVLSSLRAIGALESVEQEKIENFLVFRQTNRGGFSGRVGKKEDVCYSFWVLASLRILGSDVGNEEALEKFIMECQGPNGGFSDRPNNECDLYHLMFSLASLSLLNTEDYCEIDPGFGM